MTENIKNQKLNSVVWSKLNWKVIERKVFRLQKRIYRAKQRGDVRTVRSLQRLLLKSWYAKLLAVRRVTQDNQGKKTAGVDGIKSLTPKERLKLVNTISLKDKVKPTRRIWIPKPGREEKRPLGIPVMKDRAKQALAKIALEPEWEAIFEPNSYGFRPGRAAHDAVEAIFDSLKKKSRYVLDADIEKCFDRINHQYLIDKLNTFSQMRRYIKACLKSGVMDGGKLFPSEEGTPQGGVISPLLANIALHGLESFLKDWVWESGYRERKKSGLNYGMKDIKSQLGIVRYADDFVIMHHDIDLLKKVKIQTENWLKEVGLKLKESKTTITHTLNEYEGRIGFDFLGFNIRQHEVGKYKSKFVPSSGHRFKTIIKPSKEKCKKHYQEIREVVKGMKPCRQDQVIGRLNPIIRGWCNYYSTVVSKKEFSRQDKLLWQILKTWADKRHPKKSVKWKKDKYWKRHSEWDKDTVKYIHRMEFTDGEQTLAFHADKKITRHTKVKRDASPYDGNWVYWSTRRGKHPETPTRVATLLKKQKGKCSYCGQHFNCEDVLEVDHIIPSSKGGKDEYKNWQLLHRHCHDVKTTTDGSNGAHVKSQLGEKRNEVKVSRSVLKTSRRGDSLA